MSARALMKNDTQCKHENDAFCLLFTPSLTKSELSLTKKVEW